MRNRMPDQVGNCQQHDGVGNRHEPEGHTKKFIGVEHDQGNTGHQEMRNHIPHDLLDSQAQWATGIATLMSSSETREAELRAPGTGANLGELEREREKTNKRKSRGKTSGNASGDGSSSASKVSERDTLQETAKEEVCEGSSRTANGAQAPAIIGAGKTKKKRIRNRN